MKILVLTSTYSRWPDDHEPKFVDNLCHHLASDNEVHVLAPHYPGSKTKEQLGRVTVTRFRYFPETWETLAYHGGILPNLRQNPVKYLLVPFFLAAQLIAVFNLLRKGDYDLIHAHWIIPQGFTATMALRLARRKTPLVVTSHGGDLFSLSSSLLSKLKQAITRSADTLTVVSSAMKSRAIETGLKSEVDIEVIPMGVDALENYLPPTTDQEREGLLFVGRLVDKKGVEYLIDAMPAILARHPEQRLTIVGDGPLRESLEQRCADCRIKDRVSFLGAQLNDEIPNYLRKCAVCIFPSVVTDTGDQEGTPVAIMEALACECSAIVSDYPGARDIIKQHKTGVLVSERSSGEISKQAIELLNDPDLRRRLGDEGRKLILQQYDWRIVSGKFLKIFAALIPQTQVRPEAKIPAHEDR